MDVWYCRAWHGMVQCAHEDLITKIWNKSWHDVLVKIKNHEELEGFGGSQEWG